MMQEEYPLVSILVPCFNHERYIKVALSSILEDTYPNKEILIINDGSTDNSNTIIAEWIGENGKQINIKYLNRENKGVCATLNELILLSLGKYVLILASDDALHGNTIANRVKILESEEENNKLVLVCDAIVIDNEGKKLFGSAMTEYNRGNKAKYYSIEGILEEVILNPSIAGPTVFINKKIYQRIGMYPEDMFTEDLYFYQRAAAIGAIVFWDKQVSFYRVHDKNASGINISPGKRKMLIKAGITTFYRNLAWFPTIRFKFLAFKEMCRYIFVLFYFMIKTQVFK